MLCLNLPRIPCLESTWFEFLFFTVDDTLAPFSKEKLETFIFLSCFLFVLLSKNFLGPLKNGDCKELGLLGALWGVGIEIFESVSLSSVKSLDLLANGLPQPLGLAPPCALQHQVFSGKSRTSNRGSTLATCGVL